MTDHENQYRITICYILPKRTWVKVLLLPTQATVAQALKESKFAQAFPEVDPWKEGVGIFGNVCSDTTPLSNGDRVEIYRSLIYDPKILRLKRAVRQRLQKNKRV